MEDGFLIRGQCSIQEVPRSLQQRANNRFYRNDYCEVGPEDTGNHLVATTITDNFLDFTLSCGNNLRGTGLKAGCK
ncbi:hypothetical protein BGZ60DRAFT_554356 [Tricladium varicosporioides]|nr:hypothetical protein BGZ60DRAFT_554356 [Hymenoscyphus varicosporioides]